MFRKILLSALGILLLGSIVETSKADDIEIYFGQPQPVNLLLVLDVSGSMAWTTDTCNEEYPYDGCYPENGEPSRIDIMKEALDLFLNDLPDNVKVGILTYSAPNRNGHNIRLLHEVKKISENNHKVELLNTVEALEADGGTLAAGAMYQAARYYQGEYGNFASPITNDCVNASNIIFLTDGVPNSLRWNRWAYHNAIENNVVGECERSDDGKDCTIKIAEYLANNNQLDINPSTVKTHTIAFALENQDARDFLEDVAKKGDGGSYSADSTEGLVEAFKSSVQSDIEQSMLVTPSVPLSQSNRLSTSDELFLALFRPEKTQLWPGNLKKYYLKDGAIVDKNKVSALTDDGQFVATASSAWSSNDGNDVVLGGAAQNMDMPRMVYSNILEKNLWTKKNRVEIDNNKIDAELLGLPEGTSDAELEQHISWLYNDTFEYQPKGENQDPLEVNRFGDLLHSQPVSLRYSDKSLLFVGDNDGYLHAINPADNSGKEEWAFIPRQLLKNTANFYKNEPLGTVEGRSYGLDGDITIYHDDRNKDGVVNNGETAYLYVGMRRGGQNYYGLDISNPDTPQVMFTITGDKETSDEITAGLSWDNVQYYEGLGETWSKPFVGHVKWRGNSKKLVMIFGGGYDSATQDNAKLEAGANDTIGNNVFIADAITGQMLWNAKTDTQHKRAGAFADLLTNSFPADIAAGDLRGTGTIEHFYAADTGGQLFRFDIIQEKPFNALKIQGAKVADIQGSGVAGNRRFFTKPDISFVKLHGRTIGMVGIGSGYRAHPLEEGITDRFYLFYDKKIMSRDFEDEVITENTLYDITDKKTETDPNTGEQRERYVSIFDILSEETKNNGWYLRLGNGEKVLSDSSTINYRLFFTTYSPSSADDGELKQCKAVTGANKLYAVSVLDGKPAFFRETLPGGELGDYERSIDLLSGGIAPPFSVFFPIGEDGGAGDAAAFVGLEQICSGNDCDFLDQLTTLKWRELTGEKIKELKNQ